MPLSDNAYDIVWVEHLDVLEDRSRDEFWIARVVAIMLDLAGDYKRRVLVPASTFTDVADFSHLLVDCPNRRLCAGNLVDAPLSEISDPKTLKIRLIFYHQLVEAKMRGTLCPVLYDILYQLAHAWELHNPEACKVSNIRCHYSQPQGKGLRVGRSPTVGLRPRCGFDLKLSVF